MEDKSTKYFGSRYLARDLYGNLSVTVLFFIIAIYLVPGFKTIIQEVYDTFSGSASTSISSILVTAAFGLALTVVGYIANGLSSLAIHMIRKIPKCRGKFGYDKLYYRTRETINIIYYCIFPNDGCLFDNPFKERRIGSKIDRIIKHLALLNDSGYIEVYRYYMFVSLTRQALIYSITLSVFLGIKGEISWSIFALLSLLLWLESGRRVKDAVMCEYDFILSCIYGLDQYKNEIPPKLSTSNEMTKGIRD